ncbi:MAG: serine/threonine-protein kinase, partial [Thermoguttaceae bacterium]
MNERELFEAALEHAPAERARFLDVACAGDTSLRGSIEALLARHAEADSFLEKPAVPADLTSAYRPVTESPGSVIGSYKLLQQIGEGGMGIVYMAEQQEPVRRKVALKIIKPGMDCAQVIARFEAERQALALMDHQNIARVFDAGTTDTGRPYFVMELVHGIPITTFCDANRLTLRERLELFIPVCQAIQHAHQKGIIHRDVKPSNVLVTMYDDKPVPKVIDFGIAKATDQRLTERTMFTHFGAMVGTFEYMSPEQAEMNAFGVDTRSDVYSLGVLLYELLTGTTPLERARLREAAFNELIRLIKEEEPPRPSVRLSTSGTSASVAAARKAETAQLSKLVRGDLDWIVMRALEKDRSRRYETASGLAKDVQRHLNDEAVEACPPSAGYKLRKFAHKHQAALTTAVAMILLLLAGAAVSTWQAVRATRAEAAARAAEEDALRAQQAETERAMGERLAKLDAERRQVEAERQKSRAEAGEKLASERLMQVAAEKKKAEEEKQIALSVRDFLQNKLLGQADLRTQADALLRTGRPSAEVKENPTIRELLDRAAQELAPERIDADFPNQPLIQAEILQTVGCTYYGVGEYERAIGFLQRSAEQYRQHVGLKNRATLNSMHSLAAAYLDAGKRDLALPLFQETLKLRKETLGLNHSDTLGSMNSLAAAYQDVGKLDLAFPLYEETLKLRKETLGLNHPDTLNSMHNLATAYLDAGKRDLALLLFQETLKLRKETLGLNHPDTLQSMG